MSRDASRFQEDGRSEDEVLAAISQGLSGDHRYERGKIVGTMVSQAHPLARQVYADWLDTNVGDRGLFPGIAHFENEVIARLGELLSEPGACGNVVSGGSEANLLALWAARDRRPGRRRLLIPDTAHVSYDKAARLLQLEATRIPVGEDGRVDAQEVARVADDQVAAIVGIAGTTDLGTVDPVPELAALATKVGAHLHVDAAFGGFVLPFLRDLGRPSPDFDFSVPGVSSIAINPHKMGLAVQPAGGLLFRSKEDLDAISVEVGYLSGGATTQATVTGTRPGAAVLAAWAMLEHFGRAGYRAMVAACLEATDRFAREVESCPGLRLKTKPVMNIVGLQSNEFSVGELASRLRQRGWAVSLFRDHVRVVLLPHVQGDMIAELSRDLSRL